MERPRLALTVGDPAGIGPEIVLKALASPERPAADYLVFGPLNVLLERARRWGLPMPQDSGARVVDVAVEGAIPAGVISAPAGKAARAAPSRIIARWTCQNCSSSTPHASSRTVTAAPRNALIAPAIA